MIDERYEAFTIADRVYRHVQGHPIHVSILAPKNIKPGKHPILVRFHGGCLVEGVRLGPFFRRWVLRFAELESAVVITPDYRLLPEATGPDILSDVRCFWTWMRLDLPGIVSELIPGVKLDVDRVVVTGESAGGYLAVQSALLHPALGIRGVIAHSPMLDLRDRFYTEAYEKTIADFPGQAPADVIDAHVRNLGSNAICTSSEHPGSRTLMAVALLQQGKVLQLLGEDTVLYPMENIERAPTVPPMWLLHGQQDDVIPMEGTVAFVDKLKEYFPRTPLLITLGNGDHEWDDEFTVDSPEVREGLEFIREHW